MANGYFRISEQNTKKVIVDSDTIAYIVTDPCGEYIDNGALKNSKTILIDLPDYPPTFVTLDSYDVDTGIYTITIGVDTIQIGVISEDGIDSIVVQVAGGSD